MILKGESWWTFKCQTYIQGQANTSSACCSCNVKAVNPLTCLYFSSTLRLSAVFSAHATSQFNMKSTGLLICNS